MFARVPEPIPGLLFVGDAVPATFLERRLLHRLRRPSGLPHHVSQCSLSHLSHSSFLSKRTWLCSFALSVSAASALLLPLSIISNEVIVLYPHSDYVQWLNPSLIKGSVVHLSQHLVSVPASLQVCGTWCFLAATYHSFSVCHLPTCSVNLQALPVSAR